MSKLIVNEFVNTMNSLGYEVDIQQEVPKAYLSLFLAMAYRIKHLEDDLRHLASQSSRIC